MEGLIFEILLYGEHDLHGVGYFTWRGIYKKHKKVIFLFTYYLLVVVCLIFVFCTQQMFCDIRNFVCWGEVCNRYKDHFQVSAVKLYVCYQQVEVTLLT